MMETNLIQSCRISLLESKMNQSQQKANFQLELPEVAAYHAQPLPSVGDNLPLLCHCGLEPRLDTVLAPGPSLGKVFYRCIQRGVEQCSFFQFKQDDLAQVTQLPKLDHSCNCGLKSSVRKVQKSGPNFGRTYQACPKPRFEDRCQFFQFCGAFLEEQKPEQAGEKV